MKYVLQIIVISVLLISVSNITSQSFELSSKNKKALKNYYAAETAFKSFDYTQTLEYLQKAIEKDNDFIEAWLLMGDVYTELKRNKDAILAFNEAIGIDSAFFPRAYFFIGNLAFKEGEYKTSASYYRRFLQFSGQEEITLFLAKKRIERAKHADSILNHPLGIRVINPGLPVNTTSDEYINFVDESAEEMVLTRKVESNIDLQGRILYNENFYRSEADSINWTSPEVIAFDWLKERSIGGMNMTVDGRKMYFTGCNWPTGFGSCDLYVSHRVGEVWESAVNLGSNVNSQWWDSQPVISADGNRIFFSSKRSGGKGGSDIWMSIRLDSGKWSPPVNLGDSINTGGNEMAPFLHADGKTLYFSSDGHNGLGGTDLFISRKDHLGRWSRAENLGYPINTKYNEINLFMTLDGQSAFLSSDRLGGEGGFDIYQLNTVDEIKPELVYFVKGFVIDKTTGMPLKAEVTLTNLLNGRVVDETKSDAKTGEFLMVLHPNVEYAFNITKPKYLFYSEHFNYTKNTNVTSTDKVFELEPATEGKRIVLENVFFDFNKTDLKQKSYIELDKLYRFLNDNLDVEILIGGHTDAVGNATYNLKLSEQRAKVVFQYLIEKGISPERLSYKGFGADEPIADNITEEGRAKNRRTEIIVL